MSISVSQGFAEELWTPLDEEVAKVLGQGRPCMLCIAGNSGCGKSVIGKIARKRGLGGAPAREVLVIDDGVASVTFLGVLRRRVRFPSREKDHLAPFQPYARGKKVVVYVNSQPARRIDACDILVEVRCNEALRARFLGARNVDGMKRVEDTAGYRLVPPRAEVRLVVENDGERLLLLAKERGAS